VKSKNSIDSKKQFLNEEIYINSTFQEEVLQKERLQRNRKK